MFSDDIVNDQIYSADVRNDTLAGGGLGAADLKPGSVGTSEVALNSLGAADLAASSVGTSEAADNSLTGTDVNEATLGPVPNADTLDGQDSSAFAQNGSESWHEVGSAGQTSFSGTSHCSWGNFDGIHNSAAFLRDRFGFVHLKGLIDADDVGPLGVTSRSRRAMSSSSSSPPATDRRHETSSRRSPTARLAG